MGGVWVGGVCVCVSQSVFFHVLQVCSTNTGVLHPVAVMSTSVLCVMSTTVLCVCHVYQGTVCHIYQCTVCVSCLPVYCLCVMSTSVLSVCHVYQCTVCVLCLPVYSLYVTSTSVLPVCYVCSTSTGLLHCIAMTCCCWCELFLRKIEEPKLQSAINS